MPGTGSVPPMRSGFYRSPAERAFRREQPRPAPGLAMMQSLPPDLAPSPAESLWTEALAAQDGWLFTAEPGALARAQNAFAALLEAIHTGRTAPRGLAPELADLAWRAWSDARRTRGCPRHAPRPFEES